MARYRERDENDLVWNRTRRHITATVRMKAADIVEEILNDTLTVAWDRYVEATKTGTSIELDDVSLEWIEAVLREKLRPQLEAQLADVANG
jgi:hypothetical protein